jgi:hypothetical protein
MPKYTVDKAFWHKGHLLPAGSSVTLTKAEAKYLPVVEEQAAPAAVPAVAEVVIEAAPEPSPAIGASVMEQAPHATKRQRRVADNAHSAD